MAVHFEPIQHGVWPKCSVPCATHPSTRATPLDPTEPCITDLGLKVSPSSRQVEDCCLKQPVLQ